MTLYEDGKIIAEVPDKMLGKGHIIVSSKEKCGNIQEISAKDFHHLIYGSSFAATALFENLDAHGTNIILSTGNALEKEEIALKIDVLARWGDDGLNLLWKPKQMAQEELDGVAKQIKNKADMIGIEKKNDEVVDLDKKPEQLEPEESKKEEKNVETNKDEREKENKKEKTEIEKKKDSSKNGKGIKENKEDNKKNNKDDKKETVKEKEEESYLIKQLRRVP